MSIAKIQHAIGLIYAVAIPVFILTIAFEFWAQRRAQVARRRGYALPDSVTSISLGIWMFVGAALLQTTILAFHTWLYQFRLIDLPVGALWVWPLAILADDFTFYWYHRVHHRSRFFWAIHGNHHSSQHYNFSTALRQPVLAWLTAPFFFAPLALLGIHPVVMMTVQAISLVYQFFLHTELVGKLGPLEWVMNTPSHHRVHHARNTAYLDRNYAGIFILWDRLFGTFAGEEAALPVEYGLTHQLVYPPGRGAHLWYAFGHELFAIARDLRSASTWRQRWGYVFGPPGWGHGETTAELQKIPSNRQAASVEM